jgi:hypothetical protein
MEVEVTTITVKNIPPLIYERLKQQAENNHRSINSEIITILEQTLQMRSPSEMEQILEGVRKVRELTAHYVATEEEITRWKNEGRE